MKVAIIGGGAAGFFSAISVKENYPGATVTIFEKSSKLLAKVKISGGGRCNVTNGCPSISELSKAYPRGGRQLKKLFRTFNNRDTMEWFESRGVPLKVEEDGRVFPVSNNSDSIIQCLLKETKKQGIAIETRCGIASIIPEKHGIRLNFISDRKTEVFEKVIVASGGSPKKSGLAWLEALGHEIEEPVPSLFTFNMPEESITELPGIVAEHALTSIQGTKLESSGPLLITHWGMSGPAILKLSAFGARVLHEMGYSFTLQVNWVGEKNHQVVADHLQELADENAAKILSNVKPYRLSERLWLFLLDRIELSPRRRWDQLGKKWLNKLVHVLTNDEYRVSGKTTFKEEFVTCGGVSLQSVDMQTMESRTCKNLYFAGEVLDIDAITGGYNFQGAWTTGFVAGQLG